MTRRDALKHAALGSAVLATAPSLLAQPQQAQAVAPSGPFTLAPLPYAVDALEPHIDARTMEIHHGKHHATYVANLNKAVAGQSSLAGKSVDDLVRSLSQVPEAIRNAVRNNGGGHLNHTAFWGMMKKGGGGEPTGELRKAIETHFASFAGFKEAFTKAALGQFGSGWAWLTLEGKALKIESTPNQDNPISAGRVAILGLDVWEHAYYLKYQNRRADYVAAFFNVVDWDRASELFRKS
jgi:Fe-Mn family superoxide dismutase